MKKKIVELIGIMSVVSMLAAGCAGGLGGAGSLGKQDSGQDYAEEQSEQEELEASMEGMSEDPAGTQSAAEGNETDAGSGVGTDTGANASAAAWLPQGVKQLPSEKEPNEMVRTALIDTYQIPEDEWDMTRYYYNYVDLNEDGSDEIFALAVGPSVSGSGGSCALLLDADGAVLQEISLVNPPVLVTDEIIDGYHALALERSGDGAESEVVLLPHGNGVYAGVSETETIVDPASLTGTAILCNDLAADLESGEFLNLAE